MRTLLQPGIELQVLQCATQRMFLQSCEADLQKKSLLNNERDTIWRKMCRVSSFISSVKITPKISRLNNKQIRLLKLRKNRKMESDYKICRVAAVKGQYVQ